jgi:hypothetical protein
MNIRVVSGLLRQGQGDTFRSHKGADRSAVKGVRLKQIRKYHPKNRAMQPQAIKTQNRSQGESMAEIESGETYSAIKFKGLNSWITEVLQSVLNSK